MQLLIQNENFELHYDERHFYYGNMIGYLSMETMKEIFELFLQKIEAKKCEKVLVDYRQVTGVSMLALPVVHFDFLPRALALGMGKVAVVHAMNPFVLKFLQMGLEFNDKYEAQLFVELEEGINWLLGIEEPTPEIIQWNNGKLLVQKGEKYTLLETEELRYLSASEQGTVLHFTDKEHRTAQPISAFISALPVAFFQVHPDCIVNSKHIKSVEVPAHANATYSIFLTGKDQRMLCVDKQYDSRLKQFLQM